VSSHELVLFIFDWPIIYFTMVSQLEGTFSNSHPILKELSLILACIICSYLHVSKVEFPNISLTIQYWDCSSIG
jgi:hypothetical protein